MHLRCISQDSRPAATPIFGATSRRFRQSAPMSAGWTEASSLSSRQPVTPKGLATSSDQLKPHESVLHRELIYILFITSDFWSIGNSNRTAQKQGSLTTPREHMQVHASPGNCTRQGQSSRSRGTSMKGEGKQNSIRSLNSSVLGFFSSPRPSNQGNLKLGQVRYFR